MVDDCFGVRGKLLGVVMALMGFKLNGVMIDSDGTWSNTELRINWTVSHGCAFLTIFPVSVKFKRSEHKDSYSQS